MRDETSDLKNRVATENFCVPGDWGENLNKLKTCWNAVFFVFVYTDTLLASNYGVRFVWALQEAMEQRMADDLLCGSVENTASKMAILEYQLRIDAVNEYFGLYEK